MAVTTEDFVAISDHMGRYCWAVDGNDPEGWAALWTEDGVFTGIAPEPVIGHGALMEVVRFAWREGGGRIRHLIGNLHCDYQGDKDTVLARYYNFVSNWVDGGKFGCMALSEVLLIRQGGGWLIKRNDSTLFPG